MYDYDKDVEKIVNLIFKQEENSTDNIVKVSDVVKAVADQDFEKVQYLFDVMTEKESEKQKIGLCRHLFCRIPYDNYTILVKLILTKINKSRIKTVFVNLAEEVLEALKTKVDYQEIAIEMKNNDLLGSLGIMLDTIHVFDIEDVITIMPLPELLLELGTKKFVEMYINDYLEDSSEEMLSFLKVNEKRLPVELAYNLYTEIIIKSHNLREEAVERLLVFSSQNLSEQKSTLSYVNIIRLTLELKNEEFQLVNKIIQQGTKDVYNVTPMKHYPQITTDKKQELLPFKELLDKRIPASYVICIYMCTLRGQIP